MNPEEKVPSLELCRKLYEFGLTKGVKTERVWFKFDIEGWIVVSSMKAHFFSEQMGSIIFPAPDLSELLELLPPIIKGNRPKVIKYLKETDKEYYYISYGRTNSKKHLRTHAENPAIAVAKMLIKLHEHDWLF